MLFLLLCMFISRRRPSLAGIATQYFLLIALFFFRNAVIFPVVYFFYPETRYRSLEEMDDIFKKSNNVFDVVSISINEPHRYDKFGQLKPEYIEDVQRQRSVKSAHDLKVEHSEGSSS